MQILLRRQMHECQILFSGKKKKKKKKKKKEEEEKEEKEKEVKYLKMASAEIFTQRAKR